MAAADWTDHIPWWVVPIISFIPGGVAFYVARVDKRRDNRKEDSLTAKEIAAREQEADLKERAQLSAEQAAMWDRLRQERDDLRSNLATITTDRNNGWDLARACHDRCCDLAHNVNNLTFEANQYRIKAGFPPSKEVIRIPPLEQMQGRPAP